MGLQLTGKYSFMWVENFKMWFKWIEKTSLSFWLCLSSSECFSFVIQKLIISCICVVFAWPFSLQTRHNAMTKVFLVKEFTNSLSMVSTKYLKHFRPATLYSWIFWKQLKTKMETYSPVALSTGVPKSFSSKEAISSRCKQITRQINFNYCSGRLSVLSKGDSPDLSCLIDKRDAPFDKFCLSEIYKFLYIFSITFTLNFSNPIKLFIVKSTV